MFPKAQEDNTIKWFKSYKNVNNERTAAQETEILAYSIGQMVDDIDETYTFPENLYKTTDK